MAEPEIYSAAQSPLEERIVPKKKLQSVHKFPLYASLESNDSRLTSELSHAGVQFQDAESFVHCDPRRKLVSRPISRGLCQRMRRLVNSKDLRNSPEPCKIQVAKHAGNYTPNLKI